MRGLKTFSKKHVPIRFTPPTKPCRSKPLDSSQYRCMQLGLVAIFGLNLAVAALLSTNAFLNRMTF